MAYAPTMVRTRYVRGDQPSATASADALQLRQISRDECVSLTAWDACADSWNTFEEMAF